MKNGKLVFPPVTPLLIYLKTAGGISFLPICKKTQYIKVCATLTDLSQGLENLIYTVFIFELCNGVEQVASNPHASQVQRK